MSTAVATQQSQTLAKRDTLESLLDRPGYAKRFQEVLKDRAPQFMSSILSIGRNMPDVEPKSLVGAAMKAAVLDLPIEPGLGFAWMVPYKDNGVKYAQFQMGFKGYIQLALRTGKYERMNARAVNAEALCGFDEVGEPKIDWTKIDETKPAVGYAFGFKLTSGFTKICYWSKEKVMAHAQKYSQAFRSGYGSPWKTEFDKMALKTVIANELSDWGILSVEWQQARRSDQGIVKDIDAEVEFIDSPQQNERQIEDHKPEPTPQQRMQQPAAAQPAAAPAAATPAPAQPAAAAPAAVAQATAAQPAAEAPKRRGRPPGSTSAPKVEKFSPKEAAVMRKAGDTVADSAIAYPEGTTAADYDEHGDLLPEETPADATSGKSEEADLAAMGLAPEPEAAAPAPAPAAAPVPIAEPMEFKARDGEAPAAANNRALEYLETLAGASGVTPDQIMGFCRANNLAKPGQKLTELMTDKIFTIGKNWARLVAKIQAIK